MFMLTLPPIFNTTLPIADQAEAALPRDPLISSWFPMLLPGIAYSGWLYAFNRLCGAYRGDKPYGAVYTRLTP